MASRTPNEETYEVFVKEAANIVNSRPLSHVSTDPQDPASLTPNDILRPGTLTVESPGVFVEKDHYSRQKWRHAQIMVDHFWERWMKECLPGKIDRKKWNEKVDPIRVGDVVTVADDQLPRNKWTLGVITKVHPGQDGQVRAVTVKMGGKEYRRPTVKICRLDVHKKEENSNDIFGGAHVPSS
jgi:hypothetical protein